MLYTVLIAVVFKSVLFVYILLHVRLSWNISEFCFSFVFFLLIIILIIIFELLLAISLSDCLTLFTQIFLLILNCFLFQTSCASLVLSYACFNLDLDGKRADISFNCCWNLELLKCWVGGTIGVINHSMLLYECRYVCVL